METRGLSRHYGDGQVKIGVTICLGVAVLWSIMALLQLWTPVFSADIFIKLTISAAVIVAIVLVVTLAMREYLSNKELKSKGFIDN